MKSSLFVLTNHRNPKKKKTFAQPKEHYGKELCNDPRISR